MKEEPTPPPALPPYHSRRDDDAALWLRTINLMRKNPRATLLPLALTLAPFALATGGVSSTCSMGLNRRLSSTLELARRRPSGLRLTMALLGAGLSLFALVGAAATMVAVDALSKGKPLGLPQALDPAFSRMGGLLVFGIVFSLLLLVSSIGLIVFLYFVARWGLAIQAHVLDGKSIPGAFGSSWRLMRGRMMSFLALLLTAIPLGLLVLFGSSFIFEAIASPFGSNPTRTTELLFRSLAMFVLILTSSRSLLPRDSTTLFHLSARETSDV